jgi:hypothetical protein
MMLLGRQGANRAEIGALPASQARPARVVTAINGDASGPKARRLQWTRTLPGKMSLLLTGD